VERYFSSKIRDVANFPKEGIVFKDITTLLNDRVAFSRLLSHFECELLPLKADFVVGIESRGFVLGAPLADRLGIGFVPVRKPGKLPHETLSKSYKLEYGTDEIQIHKDAFCGVKNARVIVVDDLLATGGTAKAACELVTELGASVVKSCFLIELVALGGAEKIREFGEILSIIKA